MDCFWMSRPDAINIASYKPRQLKLASDLGFMVPRTLISNSPEAVEKFQVKCERLIAKPLFSGEIDGDGEKKVVFTTPISQKDLAARASIGLAPVTKSMHLKNWS